MSEDLYVKPGERISAGKYNNLVNIATGEYNCSDGGYRNTGKGTLYEKGTEWKIAGGDTKAGGQLFQITEEDNFSLFYQYKNPEWNLDEERSDDPDLKPWLDQRYVHINIGKSPEDFKNGITYFGKHPSNVFLNILRYAPYLDEPWSGEYLLYDDQAVMGILNDTHYYDAANKKTEKLNLTMPSYINTESEDAQTRLSSDPALGYFMYFANVKLYNKITKKTETSLWAFTGWCDPNQGNRIHEDGCLSVLSTEIRNMLSSDLPGHDQEWRKTYQLCSFTLDEKNIVKIAQKTYCECITSPADNDYAKYNSWVQYEMGHITVGNSAKQNTTTGNWDWPVDEAGDYISPGLSSCIMRGNWYLGISPQNIELSIPEMPTSADNILCLSSLYITDVSANYYWAKSQSDFKFDLSTYSFPIWSCDKDGKPVYNYKPNLFNIPCYS